MLIVGAGPGDPDLITVAGLRALRRADVVLYDRLAPAELLDESRADAVLIDVGKTPGHHAVPQERINELIVEHARRGSVVVRLKGGDPYVFGRGGEELDACRAAGVPVRIIPGITSAIAVPGQAGIPVTHRGISRSFTVVSGHVPFDDAQYRALAGIGGTIVVLMGVNTMRQVVTGLARGGMRADVPLAVVERGFSEARRTRVATVGTAGAVFAGDSPRSPAVIVIGEVVRRAEVDPLDEAALQARVESLVGAATP
ncbi:hypothetical protein GCM10011490_07170 [Pseudoclavibacter endophyticus]|uniref:uroporphyrinogen-III C-methyltransferase n=1 Tax=Pseudoclavibacter endophyticus TaxID=1778590 RepID=UPI00198D147F|nr:uroporphyrinogen-III C-methyltransferase [Pseudoclavibacter endophyticus]GGA59657.1 hypothetical protein GCM10011490_07170 [Pseudoclavibacter endophyticus]